MSFFKKPAVAVLLAIILILASTLLSAWSKISNECGEVLDGFYSGVKYNGKVHPSISKQLSTMLSVADQITLIANGYEISTDELSSSTSALKDIMRNSPKDIAMIYDAYSVFIVSLRSVTALLQNAMPNEGHNAMIQDYSTQISECIDLINSSGYNDSVKAFLKSMDYFPANIIVKLSAIDLPAYFS